eukprot:14135292-Ditylum_brightwellii.AAC.1
MVMSPIRGQGSRRQFPDLLSSHQEVIRYKKGPARPNTSEGCDAPDLLGRTNFRFQTMILSCNWDKEKKDCLANPIRHLQRDSGLGAGTP